MAIFNKYDCFVENLAEKVHNLGSDTLKIALTNTAPSAAHTVLANITEISAGGGYSAGGGTVVVTTSTQTAGTYTLAVGANDVVFTATTGFGPFRYAVLYNSTAAGGPLIGWWDYGSSVSCNASETFTVDLTSSMLTLV